MTLKPCGFGWNCIFLAHWTGADRRNCAANGERVNGPDAERFVADCALSPAWLAVDQPQDHLVDIAAFAEFDAVEVTAAATLLL